MRWDSFVVQAATLVTAAAVLLAAAVWMRTRTWSPAVPVLLELLLAAGLLRLTADLQWHAIGGAAVIVGIRTLISSGARRTRPPTMLLRRRPGPPGHDHAAATAGRGGVT